MVVNQYRTLASYTVLLAVGLVNLIILPDKSIDPINSPKLFALGAFGLLSLFIVVQLLIKNPALVREIHFVAALLLVLHLTVVMSLSGRYEDQFFGVFGRNTGYLALVSLIGLFLCASLVRSEKFAEGLTKVLIACGVLAMAYGLLQVLGLDPVTWGASGYKPIYGFLGNPNFESAFLGMTGSAFLAFAISKKIKVQVRLLFVIGILVSGFVILKSESEQGFLVLISGSLTVVMVYLYSIKNKSLLLPAFVFSLGLGLISILGLTNRGPLAGILYKDSIQFRGDYWRAAWKMGFENPLTGVGIDRFGENYRGYRDLLATTRRGPDVTSNSAHNVFLDVFSNTGFIGAGLYMFLHLLTVVAIVRFLRSNSDYKIPFTALTSAWIAYVAQSIVSVNQLGLAVWGWVLMGAIIGLSLSPEDQSLTHSSQNRKKTPQNDQDKLLPGTLLKAYIVIAVGAIISIWPLASDVGYVNALKSGNATKIQEIVYARPLTSQKTFNVANILLDNKFEKESLQIIRDGVKTFPNTFELWKIMLIQPGATSVEIAEANRQMKRLDPFNPELK
jgi:O-antigen ligase